MPDTGFLRFISVTLMFVLTSCSSEPTPDSPAQNDHSPKPAEQKTTANHSAKPATPFVDKAADAPPQEFGGPANPQVINAPKPTAPATVYRNAAEVFKHDDVALAKVGIHRYAGTRLIIYTDVPADVAQTLPAYGDALYAELVNYFGELPPARDKQDYQVVGYIMADPDRFEAAGLLPENLPGFLHGRHRGLRFWMNDQEFPYYRRHLVLHEFTHCFMTAARNPQQLPPVWYMEGMAELFATHQHDSDGKIQFRVFPADTDQFTGWGRISLVQQEVAADRFLTLNQLESLPANDYLKNEPYAWSWAFCAFCDSHPRFQSAFRALNSASDTREFARIWQQQMTPFASDWPVEWALFAHHLVRGYNTTQSAINNAEPWPPNAVNANRFEVAANRGWQTTTVAVKKGQTVQISASGRFTLAQTPKPWVSESAGISYDYSAGKKLGRLLAAVRAVNTSSDNPAAGLLQVYNIGKRAEFLARQDGVICLRLNDHWHSLSDNAGKIRATVRVLEPVSVGSNASASARR